MSAPILIARDLQRHYRVPRGLFQAPARLHALNGVSFELRPGETLAVVGESGCGKSTLARVLSLIEAPDQGSLQLDGLERHNINRADRQRLRTAVQMVFQNPHASLNPKRSIGAQLEEPLVIQGLLDKSSRHARVTQMLERVGLRAEHAQRYPHMFSGGQRQRIAIARAMMLNPKVIIADEPTSALDVSVQAQVLNLFMDLQAEFGTAYVFISHNLAVVRQVADQLLVMYQGRVVEQGPASLIYQCPLHPYTRLLLASTPGMHAASKQTTPIGEPGNPLAPQSGCAFRTRCPNAQPLCQQQAPALRSVDGRVLSCHYAELLAVT